MKKVHSEKVKTVEFFDEIYLFQWLLYVGGTPQAAIDYFCEKLHVESFKYENNNPIGHFFTHRPYKAGLLWFKDKECLKSQGVHECFHATMYLFETLDMKGPVEETEEVFAYYMQWLFTQVMRQ